MLLLCPCTDETWQAFKTVQTMLGKGSKGKKVSEVMTSTPITGEC